MNGTGFYVGLNAGYGWAKTSITGATGSSNLIGFVVVARSATTGKLAG